MRISIHILFILIFFSGCNSNIGKVSYKNNLFNSNSFLSGLTPTFVASDVSEGNGLAITFSLPRNLSTSMDYDWVITGDDVPGDFAVASGTISLGAGDNSGVIVIPTTENSIYDLNRNYQLSIRADYADAVGGVDGFRVMDDEATPVLQFSVASQNVNENAVLPTATVSLTPASKFPVSVNFAVSGTASAAGVDHSLVNGTVNFAAGATSNTIALSLVDDVIAEPGETLILTLGSIVGSAVIGANNVQTVTIVDNENVNLTISDVTVSEGGVASFTVSLSSANAVDVTFDWATADGTGDSVNDYISDSATGVTILAGNLSTNVSVTTRADALICEANKTFSVVVSNVNNAAVTDGTGVGTITDPDSPTVAFSAASSSASEGTATDTVTNVVGSLSAVCASRNVTFDVVSAAGTATSGTDFGAIASTEYTITAGNTTVNIPVTSVKDALFEVDETFTLTMSNAVGATLGGQTTHTFTILNDDSKPTISIADVTFTEGTAASTANATMTVTLSSVSGVSTQVNYATSDGTAVQPADYTSSSGTLTIAAGQGSGTFTVPVVRDSMDEFDETVNLTLSGGNGNYEAVGSDLTAVLTITDDDLPPTISVSLPTAVTEGGLLAFNVTLSAASGKTITADFVTSDGTAIQPGDYTSNSTSVTINPGSTSQAVNVTTIDDVENCELTETVNGTISNLVNATAGTLTRAGSILENDLPLLTLNSVTLTEGASAAITMTASLSCPNPITANYASFGNTAIEIQDFTHAEGVFTIPANLLTSNTVNFSTTDDDIAELTEIFFVGISSPNVGTIGTSAIVTVEDNEGGVAPARVAVSLDHSCVLSNQGTLKCWGAAYQGATQQQLLVGDAPNETQTLSTPVPIPGPYISVAIGQEQACVLRSTGGVRCWGNNSNGSLGIGNGHDVVTPAAIAALTDINFGAGRTATSLCAGSNFTCAIMDNKTVKCFGAPPGNGSASYIGYNVAEIATALPVNLGGDLAESISCGATHACVITSDDEVRCWGTNASGQLGNNSTVNSPASVAPNLGTGLTALSVSAGENYTCAVLQDAGLVKRAKCWGNGTHGKTGQGDIQNRGDGVDSLGMPADEMGDNLLALDFGVAPEVKSVHTSDDVTCVGFVDDSYRCWGLTNYHGNGVGTLGDNPGELALLSPLNFGVNTAIEGLSAKTRGFCALIRDTISTVKSVRCFGSNTSGVLGENTNPSTVPFRNTAASANAVAFDPSFTVTRLSVAYGDNNFQCAIGTNGISEEVRCWGANGNNETGGSVFSLGDEIADMGASLPTLDPGFDGISPVNIVDVKLGARHTCILSDTGKVKCIGLNSRGQLGDGTANNWGDTLRNDGTRETLANQSFVNLPRPAISIAAGGEITCAITDLSDLYCWGYYGGFSNNSSTQSSPVLINLGTNLKALGISVGGNHLCALLNTQGVKCWGTNSSHVLGIFGLANGVTVGRNAGEIAALSQINFGTAGGIPLRVKSVYAGDNGFTQSCAVFHNDSARCWGYNGYGALGANTNTDFNQTFAVADIPLVQLAEPLLSFIPGYWANCVITRDLRFKCFGGVFEGENPLGIQYTAQNLIQPAAYANFGLDGMSNPKKIWNWSGSGSTSHYCAIVDPGEVKCWGRNTHGVLGYGDLVTRGDTAGETPDTFPAVDFGF